MLVLFALLTVLFVLGVPVGYAMGLAAVVVLLAEGEVPLIVLAQNYYGALDSFSLLAVPLFVLAGELMNVAGITERIVGFSRAVMGHLRGGLAQANILSNMFMAAISGSAVADVAAIGSMLIPAMKREGYKPEFAVAVTSCAAMMAPIIPPSIIAVIYGSVTGVSVGALFLGGVVPGVLAGFAFMVLTWYLAPRAGGTRSPRASAAELGQAAQRAAPAMLMPAIIIGGITSGAFTPTEASAVACGYALLFGAITGRHTLAGLRHNILAAGTLAASALITLGGAAMFGWLLARNGVGAMALSALQAASGSASSAMLVMVVFLLIVGTVLEPLPALVLCIPVLQPILRHYAIHPVQFGVVAMMILTVGSVTPPVGVLAMITAKIAGIPYGRTFGMLAPFVLVWTLVALAAAFIPPLVLFIPSLAIP